MLTRSENDAPLGDRPLHDDGAGTSSAVRSTLSRDRERCEALLPEVSRTFALSIEALPAELRRSVMVAYLLCRMADTVEDTPDVAPERRAWLFAELSRLLRDDTRPVGPFADEASASLAGAHPSEWTLCATASPAVLRLFRHEPELVRRAVRGPVLEMVGGMAEHRERLAKDPQRGFASLEELERYCYFVAGTVGLLLTGLFELHARPAARVSSDELRADAVRFGLGLQLVNIVKDVAADAERGECFLPRELMEREKLTARDLLSVSHRAQAQRAVRPLIDRAHQHLRAAGRYTRSWELPAGQAVRAFCAVPLGLAVATLQEVERGPASLRPGQSPKIGRDVVARVWSGAHEAVGDDESLARWLGELGLVA